MGTDFLKGIDVSHHQGKIDWQKVATAGISFAFAKATEWAHTKDEGFPSNYSGMKSVNIIRGAYHFFRPYRDPDEQADNFLAMVDSLAPGDLPPALDVEVDDGLTSSAIISGIATWMTRVKDALGRTPIVYTSASFWNDKLHGCTDFTECPLWVAHYTTKPAPKLPNGFSDYAIWQHSEKGNLVGIGGNVDLDRFNGTMDELRQLAGL